ncbi:MAG: hypothetical protein NZ528_09370 [Caldilineales bacterium]|nr:hypothetical protein [Caldilineales bacterium]MDW8318310.1 hypothetical protein [Anaerolineae bacterium]
MTRPVWSLELGARWPLAPPPTAPPIFGGEERERQPTPYVGGTFTWHF